MKNEDPFTIPYDEDKDGGKLPRSSYQNDLPSPPEKKEPKPIESISNVPLSRTPHYKGYKNNNSKTEKYDDSSKRKHDPNEEQSLQDNRKKIKPSTDEKPNDQSPPVNQPKEDKKTEDTGQTVEEVKKSDDNVQTVEEPKEIGSGFFYTKTTAGVNIRFKKQPVDQDQLLWVSKYSPKTLQDFVGHSKQIQQIREWLQDHRHKKPGTKMGLMIVGPPGCGKTLMARLIPESLGYDTQEFNSTSVVHGKRERKLPKNSPNSEASFIIDGIIPAMVRRNHLKPHVVILDQAEDMATPLQYKALWKLPEAKEVRIFFFLLLN